MLRAAKMKLRYQVGLELAQKVVTALRPGCARVEIAGSIRRKKVLIGDLEIVAIPLQTDLFGNHSLTMTGLDVVLAELVQAGKLAVPTRDGPRYKQFGVVSCPGLWLDLFLCEPQRWGVTYTLRTGSANFSRKAVTPRWRGGYLPKGFKVEGGRIIDSNDDLIETPEESDVFEVLTCGWISPEKRR